ncbi:MAG: DUF4234 domain-containing protein [Ruminiclostridium sp.]|nr:DUF4234 domain-containing protein [Ruminiclostridium sp.]
MFTKRSIPVFILLSIVTCGIYLLVWYWQTMSELYRAGGKSLGNLEPVVQFILLFFYVGGVFFALNADDNLNAVREQRGLPRQDNKVLYLVLEILGFGLITCALVQNEMNKLAE